MERLLVQTRASDKDPALADQKIEGVPFNEFFRNKGIKILKEELVASCHGNTAYSLAAAEGMQKLADEGHKVVSIQSGGLYFARPSLEAAQAPTIPIISVPLGGIDAFLAVNLPAGHAAIGGVAPGNYRTAAKVAERILEKHYMGVCIWGTQPIALENKLNELHVPILGRISASGNQTDMAGSYAEVSLLIGDVMLADLQRFETETRIGIYSCSADPVAHMKAAGELRNSVYARGVENVAIFAAKIVAASSPETAEALKKMKADKASTYKKPDMTLEAFA